MKRDMDVIRQILLALDEDGVLLLTGVDGMDKDVFCFHAQLLLEAGLAEGALGSKNRGYPASAQLWRLTWEGFDFAATIREDTLWKKAKDVILKPSASWSFGLLREYLKTEMARKLPGLEQIL
ncbi:MULTISPECIES: DUF2513 domain-containing protein [Pseudomonas]|nr:MULTISPECIES: DUF2513 domain-containing protein [Pseudomonas]KSO10381.1 hypothetical protein APA84_20995 [Pseudomonas aeruginosa]MBH3748667.1 DUF2513 domain-containing protein [Pseudomonas aeruginosa]MBH3817072.1 DUF2513 domain-containing protein [Pseudomonas aeruginosa]MBN0631282.1 DUF2513 domain-containing protein [Pseudomonas aeruginosa]MCS6536368.1 DUF2513 domain-containing protein [Pseudomonas aeruginosa]